MKKKRCIVNLIRISETGLEKIANSDEKEDFLKSVVFVYQGEVVFDRFGIVGSSWTRK